MTEAAPKMEPEASADGHARFMRLALDAAERSALAGEVPVGAVIVVRNEIVATAHNERETRFDPTAHAEIVALRRAAEALGSWRLVDAELYVTMEPCPMCAGALVNARVRRVVYGCDDPKAGAVRTLYRILDDARLNHRVDVVPGVLAADGAALLKRFFSRLRGGPGAAVRAASANAPRRLDARAREAAPEVATAAAEDPGARP